ncbi:unnamed protein product [Cochlearia groenlandica]
MMNGVTFFLCFLMVVVSVNADLTFNDDVLGLIVFKAGLDDPYSKLSSWNTEDYNPCNWIGCVCDPATNLVTELRLDGFSLSGHIGRGLVRLQSLHTLVLSNNNLTGTLNPELPHLGTLQLIDFSGNNLSGRIPYGFFEQCGSLRSVSFANNKLSGPLPVSLGYCSTLTHLNLSSNQLSGRLPRELWLLKSLKSLDLSENYLQGEVPDGMGGDIHEINLSKNWFSGDIPCDMGRCYSLKSIDLSENYFSGNLPVTIKSLHSCISLRLNGNYLIGEIPNWIGEMVSLETLDLSANNFSGNAPFSLGSLYLLKVLNLSTNMLSGDIPQTISNCSNLISIDFSFNSFTGDFLKWFLNFNSQISSLSTVGFLQGLRFLDLSSNGFFGEIPSNIRILTSLVRLNMSNNSMFGSIPSAIGELKLAQFLDLSSNLFNGTLPSEIGGVVSLKQIHLQRNLLSGQIPPQISKCSALIAIDMSENKLCGGIPGSIGSLTNLKYIDLSRNNLSGSLPKEIEKLSHMVTFNISHNNITGELPAGGFFNTIPLSSVTGNPSLCGSVVNRSCLSFHPKPIVLNPNSSNPANGPPLNGQIKKSVLSISALIAIGAASFIVIGVVVVTLLNIHVSSSFSRNDAAATVDALAMSVGETFSCSPSKDQEFGKLVMFSGEADMFDTTGANALLNKNCELGRGGFGVVYKTNLQDGRPVIVKKLTVSGLIKSQEEFEREMRKVGKLRHKNVVETKGYYWTHSLQLLIHEFVSEGSLYKHLHGGESVCLTWRQRFSIILGIARGLAYLHESNINHYNLKATNVLIDATGEAKVSDFGLARLLASALDRCVLSGKVQSALGYTAPEFACRTVKITEKCDVYGFGILVLEIVTGMKPVEYAEDDVVVLCETVREGLEEGRVEECIDVRLRGNFPTEEAIPVIKLGLVCGSQVPSNRPKMEEVVKILELIQCPSHDLDQ